TDGLQILLWIGAGLIGLWGWLSGRRQESPPAGVSIGDVEGGIRGGLFAGRDAYNNVIIITDPKRIWKKPPPADLRQATEAYLKHLVNRYRYLDFKGMGVSDRIPLRLSLVDMYVPLQARMEMPEGETWSRELRLAGRKVSAEEAQAMGHRLSDPRPVLELLQSRPGLIILGDPGAGKTTFLKMLAVQLASGNADALGLGDRLPVLLPLSSYANALTEADVPLDQFIADYYRSLGLDLPLEAMLKAVLQQGRALLLLDGLDEVQSLTRRKVVVDRVVSFFTYRQQQGNKFVLTSRIVGYREVRPTCEGLDECTLVDFGEDEIASFVDRWTQALEKAARGDSALSRELARTERDELLHAIARNPGVRTLAANPLLLTILALMKRQGVVLPERRVELYQKYIETLLKTWNVARSLGRPASRDLDVVETLRLLAPLALWMHQTSPGVGLVKREPLRRKLTEICRQRELPEPETAARRLLDDVRQHAGLLLERGAGMYGFIHLTFQEYLAALAIAQLGQRDARIVVDILSKHVGDDNWREVILMTVGVIGIIQQADERAGEVVRALIKHSPGEPGQAVVLAGEAVNDARPGGVDVPTQRLVIKVLVRTLTAGPVVKPPLRAAAGDVLARLGDPRPEVMTVDGMQFCHIPAGPF
ncbi:MAG: NACHT domain-containing protein, partial [Caldilineae bacterium]